MKRLFFAILLAIAAVRQRARCGTFRIAKGIRRPAGCGPAVGLLVLAQQQHHQGRHDGRPGGHEARGHRRRADHGGRSGRAAGPRPLRRTQVAGTLQAHAQRGQPAGPGSQHDQRRRLVRQRRALDHARTVDAVPRLDGNQRGRRQAFRRRLARAAADRELLSRHHRAGLPHAGRQGPDREHQRQDGPRSPGPAAGPGQVCRSAGRPGHQGRFHRRSLRPVQGRPPDVGTCRPASGPCCGSATPRPARSTPRPPPPAAAWNATS